MVFSSEDRYRVLMDTSLGATIIEVDPTTAPRAANHFLTLVRDGFYDGLFFHRLVPGLIAQTGDPTGIGGGNPGFSFHGELPTPGSYARGTVALGANVGARAPHGSQFFLCLADAPELTPHYPIVGRVIEGDGVLDSLNVHPVEPNERPAHPIELRRMSIESTS